MAIETTGEIGNGNGSSNGFAKPNTLRALLVADPSVGEALVRLAKADGWRTDEPPILLVSLELVGPHEMNFGMPQATPRLRRARAESQCADPRLTAREREVLELVAQGLPNKKIARLLYIEVSTVKNHVHNLLEKLQMRSRGEAAAWFVRNGHAPERNGSSWKPLIENQQ